MERYCPTTSIYLEPGKYYSQQGSPWLSKGRKRKEVFWTKREFENEAKRLVHQDMVMFAEAIGLLGRLVLMNKVEKEGTLDKAAFIREAPASVFERSLRVFIDAGIPDLVGALSTAYSVLAEKYNQKYFFH